MNLRTPKGPTNSPRRWRAVRAFTAIALVVFLFTAGTAQADSVRIDKVVQTLSRYQGPADLRLGTTQDPVTGQTKSSTPTGGPRTDGPVTPASGETAKPDAGLAIVQDPQKLGVEVIEEAEVEGTICDCGEILLAEGGFPKWPLLFLAAVPLVFINDCNDCDENPITQQTPTPPPTTPTPTPQDPEQAT
jgi:hypothetical protein